MAIPIRDEMEKRGYKVTYGPDKNIVLYDPKTGRTGTIAHGTYQQDKETGAATINPSYVSSWLNPPTTSTPQQPQTTQQSSPEMDYLRQQLEKFQAYSPPPAYTPEPYEQPYIPEIDLNQAIERARRQVSPMTESMRDTISRVFQENIERLPQILNARGLSPAGGSRIAGERNLAQEKARQLTDIERQQEAQIMELAEAIMNRDTEAVARKQAQDYQQWLGQQQVAMQKYQTDLGQWNALREAASNAVAQLLGQRQWEERFGFEKQTHADALAQQAIENQFAQEQFDWEKDRWQKEFDENVRQFGLQYALSKAKSASGGGGGGRSSSDYKRHAFADALDAVDQAINGGYSREDIKNTILASAGDLAREGVDVNDVLDYLEKRKTADDLQTDAAVAEQVRLDTRPWWQKAADAVLPGSQFR